VMTSDDVEEMPSKLLPLGFVKSNKYCMNQQTYVAISPLCFNLPIIDLRQISVNVPISFCRPFLPDKLTDLFFMFL